MQIALLSYVTFKHNIINKTVSISNMKTHLLPLFSFLWLQQELCRKLHKEIDLVDDERYDMEIKVNKSNKEVRHLVDV